MTDNLDLVRDALRKHGTMGAAIDAGALPWMKFGVKPEADATDPGEDE